MLSCLCSCCAVVSILVRCACMWLTFYSFSLKVYQDRDVLSRLFTIPKFTGRQQHKSCPRHCILQSLLAAVPRDADPLMKNWSSGQRSFVLASLLATLVAALLGAREKGWQLTPAADILGRLFWRASASLASHVCSNCASLTAVGRTSSALRQTGQCGIFCVKSYSWMTALRKQCP